MFGVGDKIVHPMHGAGVVEEIVEQKIDGVVRGYYRLKLPTGSMLVMIPVDTCEALGVRAIHSGDEMERLLGSIPKLEVHMDSNWNHRYRDNMVRLRSGDLLEVAKVVKGLTGQDRRRRLSTGERKMLHTARQILVSEVGLAQCISYQEAECRVDQAVHA